MKLGLIGILVAVATAGGAMEVAIDYTNWRGERAERRVEPREISFGSTEWHPESQWLLTAYDLDRQADRQFALADIHRWEVSDKVLSHNRRDVEELRSNLESDEQREAFSKLMEFPLGKFLLEYGGLNGFWTDYVILGGEGSSGFEHFLINESPLGRAVQERYECFRGVLQNEVKEGASMASVPCGLMRDLLDLDWSEVNEFSLFGADIDPESISIACERAREKGLADQVTFRLADAWEFSGQFDVIASHGLTFYEPDDERVIALYRRFFDALKPGGVLVTSFLTPPPPLDPTSEWQLQNMDLAALGQQKAILVDVAQVTWQSYRSSQVTEEQLRKAGFDDIQFVYDSAHVMPSVVAHKSP